MILSSVSSVSDFPPEPIFFSSTRTSEPSGGGLSWYDTRPWLSTHLYNVPACAADRPAATNTMTRIVVTRSMDQTLRHMPPDRLRIDSRSQRTPAANPIPSIAKEIPSHG